MTTLNDLVTQSKGHRALAHVGVKGMKWGVRKDRSSKSGPQDVTVKKTATNNLKATGGAKHPVHDDAVKAAQAKQKAKKSGTSSLSNAELKALTQRMNLEQQLADLDSKAKARGAGAVGDILRKEGKNQLRQVVASVASDQISRRVRR